MKTFLDIKEASVYLQLSLEQTSMLIISGKLKLNPMGIFRHPKIHIDSLDRYKARFMSNLGLSGDAGHPGRASYIM